MYRILTVVGARPQFVKAALVSHALRSRPDCTEVLVHTGQHYDRGMSEIFFEELAMPAPDVHLAIGSGPHGQQTGRMLAALEEAILDVGPDVVLVYGDTNSTLAGALAASKLHVPVAHVEAGLRSFNREMPEEINRVLTDHVSSLLFAPTEVAVRNLAREGIVGAQVVRTGDVMLDVALTAKSRLRGEDASFGRLGIAAGEYVLATIHRAENTDRPDRLRVIAEALETLARDMPVVFPVHPRTRGMLERDGIDLSGRPGLHLCEPLGYLPMLSLESSARLIVTDSGGVQKEAYFHRVPCVTVRDETEWVELLEVGCNRLAPPTDAASMLATIRDALDQPVADWPPLYGDGRAVAQIVDALVAHLETSSANGAKEVVASTV